MSKTRDILLAGTMVPALLAGLAVAPLPAGAQPLVIAQAGQGEDQQRKPGGAPHNGEGQGRPEAPRPQQPAARPEPPAQRQESPAPRQQPAPQQAPVQRQQPPAARPEPPAQRQDAPVRQPQPAPQPQQAPMQRQPAPQPQQQAPAQHQQQPAPRPEPPAQRQPAPVAPVAPRPVAPAAEAPRPEPTQRAPAAPTTQPSPVRPVAPAVPRSAAPDNQAPQTRPATPSTPQAPAGVPAGQVRPVVPAPGQARPVGQPAVPVPNAVPEGQARPAAPAANQPRPAAPPAAATPSAARPSTPVPNQPTVSPATPGQPARVAPAAGQPGSSPAVVPAPAGTGAPGAQPPRPASLPAPSANPGTPGQPPRPAPAAGQPGSSTANPNPAAVPAQAGTGAPGAQPVRPAGQPGAVLAPGQPAAQGVPGPQAAPGAQPGRPVAGPPPAPLGATLANPGGTPGAQPQPAGQPGRQGQVGQQRSNNGGAIAAGAAIGFVGGFLASQAVTRLDEVQRDRQEYSADGATYYREPGRTIIEGPDDRYFIAHDENERFRDLGYDIRSERRGDEYVASYQSPDGSQITNYTDDNGRLLRRVRRFPDGRAIILIDNGPPGPPRPVYDDVVVLPPPPLVIPQDRYVVEANDVDEGVIYDTLVAPPVAPLPRRYTLNQIRYSPDLRSHMRSVDVDTITFDTGSWTVAPNQASRLAALADAINRAVRQNPQEMFLLEGYTDAVGSPVDNLSLSDRRAQSVATLLSQQFRVPAENLTTQGYGEQYLKVNTPNAEARNRRVTLRRITPLLSGNGQPGAAAQPQQ